MSQSHKTPFNSSWPTPPLLRSQKDTKREGDGNDEMKFLLRKRRAAQMKWGEMLNEARAGRKGELHQCVNRKRAKTEGG